MKIVDCFTFFNEIDLLKIRLELLYPHVDAFCICEGKYTFTGQEKPYFIEQFQEQLRPWLDKIVYYKFEPDITGLDFSKKDESFNPNSPAWHMERGQRNSLIELCKSLAGGDLIMVSDLDELPDPAVVAAMHSGRLAIGRGCRLEMKMHYYYMNCIGIGHANAKWHKAFVVPVSEALQSPGLEYMRLSSTMNLISDAGWHFSYLGGAEKVSEKINASSHTETNRPEINNLIHLKRCVELGIDHLGRPGHEYAFLPVGVYPEPLARLMRKNLNLVKTTLL